MQIPIAARLIAVADSYDALVNERIYKKSWSSAYRAMNKLLNLVELDLTPSWLKLPHQVFMNFKKFLRNTKID